MVQGYSRMFEIPPDWLPIPWDDKDLQARRRCGRQQPYDPNPVLCSRAEGHPGVCIGGRKPPGQKVRYWAWW